MHSFSDRGRGVRSHSLRTSLRSALVVAGILVVGATVAATTPSRFRFRAPEWADSTRAHAVRALLNRGLDTLDVALATIAAASSRDAAVSATRRARRPFRELESMLAHYAPTLMIQLNSDESSEPDEDPADGFKIRYGFQLLDSLFADGGTAASSWREEVRRMRLDASRFRPTVNLVAPSEREVIDLARNELARVATLTVAGFDAAEHDAIPDADASLAGVSSLLAVTEAGDSATMQRLAAARRYLATNRDFDSFDRFGFARDFMNPVFRALAAQRKRIPGVEPVVRGTWPASSGTIYDARALDVMSYAPDNAPRVDSAWASLGRALFFDVHLSEHGDRSCASCHVPELGFRDGRARALARDVATAHAIPLRHTPTLINAAVQPSQFADGRRSTLEQQIADVLVNPREMGGGSLDGVVARVAATDRYRAAVAELPRRTSATPATSVAITIDALTIENALATYIRTLRGFDSPFDKAIRGEAPLDSSARRGFNLFMGRAGCGTCHFAPLFNGTQPPTFTQSEPEVIDVPSDGANGAGRDLGRGAIDRRGGLAGAFKTPTVRNAALGGPFMHNGVFRTLGDVIAFYDAGGATRRTVRARNVTLAPDSLHLTAVDRADLEAFIASLTDTVGLTRRR